MAWKSRTSLSLVRSSVICVFEALRESYVVLKIRLEETDSNKSVFVFLKKMTRSLFVSFHTREQLASRFRHTGSLFVPKVPPCFVRSLCVAPRRRALSPPVSFPEGSNISTSDTEERYTTNSGTSSLVRSREKYLLALLMGNGCCSLSMLARWSARPW